MAHDILDRRKTIEDYFPEFLKGNKDYKIFIKLASEEIGLVTDYIELFTDLANIERTPEQFVRSLSNMVGYNFIDELDPNVQREIIKRIFNKHGARGDKHSMLMMASHAMNGGYIGGDIFVPGTYIDGQEAMIAFPRDVMFTWNKSKRSGFDKYPDGHTSMDGIIEIIVGYYDEHIKNRVETVKPAGVRLIFKIAIMFGTDVVKVRIPLIFTDFRAELYLRVNGRALSGYQRNARSGSDSLIRWSGIRRIWVMVQSELMTFLKSGNYTDTIIPYFVDYDLETIINNRLMIPFQRERSYTGLPRWSVSFVRSGKYNYSGLSNSVRLVEMEAKYRHPMNLDNDYILLSDVQDIPINGFYSPEGLNPVASLDITQE